METLFCFSRVMILSPLFSGCIRAALQFAVGAGWLYQVGLAILLKQFFINLAVANILHHIQHINLFQFEVDEM